MYISISQSEFTSSNAKNIVKVRGYNLTKDSLFGIVVILHGMSECKEIYQDFAEFLAERNYGVITYDHIGHGDSIQTKDERGFFANEKGYQYLLEDLKHVLQEAQKFHLPIFLFGHSMGSLIARNYVAKMKAKELAGLILCGTIGPQWAIDGAIQLAEYMIAQKGPRYRSRKLNHLITTISTWNFPNAEYQLEWITRDKEYIRKVKDDERMNFIFTAAGFRDVFVLTKLAGEKETIEKTPKDLPIFLVSGDEDVLGEYGQGVIRLEEAFRKAGVKEVITHLYPGARHSLIQDSNCKEVIKDIYDWIEAVRLAEKE